ncbi:MAG: hypothetical protein ACOCP4_04260 [Candidatus Woesearchaeota archaeon]
MSLPKGTLFYIEEIVGEFVECPLCGARVNEIEYIYTSDGYDVGDIVECDHCEEEFIVAEEDFAA